MQERVLGFIKKYQMLQNHDRVVVGLSGGADSVCLFLLLFSLREQLGIELAAVHVNHGLRGAEADADEGYVKELCKKLGVPCKCYFFPVAEIARKEQLSEEETGRAVRRRAFAEYMEEWKGTKLALAHHQDDAAETMLHHLARGTSLSGLCSLKPVRGNVIRPLLCMNREEVEHYLKERKIAYCTDSTNLEDAYTRNKIRHHVLSYLTREVNPHTAAHMARTAEDLGELESYLNGQIQDLLVKLRENKRQSSLLSQELLQEPAFLQRYVIRAWLLDYCGTVKNVTREHLEALAGLFNAKVGKTVSLPGNYKAVRVYEGIELQDAGKETDREIRPELLLCPGERQQIEAYLIDSAILFESKAKIPQKKYTKWLNYDRIKDNLVLRTRKQGDYLVINEAGGRKKLKDYFIDRKIPVKERDSVLLLAAGQEILWVVGYRLSEAYKVTPDTEKILRIEITGGTIHEREGQSPID